MSYTTKTAIENYLSITIDSSFDSQIEEWISSIEEYIDNYTGKHFEEVSETRYFDGNGEREIDIDEFLSITSLEILEVSGDDVAHTLTEGRENDFITFPYNTSPKFRLILTTVSSVGAFYSGKGRIKVTATFSDSSTAPDDVKLAATMLVANIVEKGLRGGKLSSESLGDYSVTFSELEELSDKVSVKKLLEPHKKWLL